MEKRTLGRTGLKVSVIGFGGIPIQRVSKEESVKVVHACLEAGIDFFDSARGYSNSEEKIGFALMGLSKPILATKGLVDTKQDMENCIKQSLQNFRVDRIDVYQIHNVATEERLNKVLGKGGAMEALVEAREKKTIKFIGVTGHKPEILLKAIKTDKFDTVQFPFNAIEYRRFLPVIDEANKRNIGIIIMKPLAGGALRHATEALKFILSHDVDVVIPGMDSVEQVKQNAKAAMAGLTAEERKTLFDEAKRLGKDFCRMCEYCMPCPQGINITFSMIMDQYYTRYDLKDWAKQRYQQLSGPRADACIGCGTCEGKCPYELPIVERMKRVKKNILMK
jgi:hypothetical protein